MGEMSGSKVTVQGQWFDVGRKPPAGQRKLHLFVEGSSRQEVLGTCAEAKR